MKLTKLHQLEALPNGTRLTDAAGRKYTKTIRNSGLHLLKTEHGHISIEAATSSYGPFHTEATQ